MKKILVSLIVIYQRFLSELIRQIVGVPHACRFNPTCSEYAKSVIAKKGILVGGYLAFVRILKCQPFYKQKLERSSYKGASA